MLAEGELEALHRAAYYFCLLVKFAEVSDGEPGPVLRSEQEMNAKLIDVVKDGPWEAELVRALWQLIREARTAEVILGALGLPEVY